MKELMFWKDLTLINQINQKNVWFFTIGILKILVINLNHMFCNGCHDISMMVYELGNIAKLNVKEFDYRCFIEYNLKWCNWYAK